VLLAQHAVLNIMASRLGMQLLLLFICHKTQIIMKCTCKNYKHPLHPLTMLVAAS